ncbi:MAG: hypothetical protein LBC76_10435 [Treponema sp.]|jgi:hypothetical protein|nr:hypothetical protein [Treponema sp.]
MSKSNSRGFSSSIGLVLLNLSVAVYLFATGIMGITGSKGGEILIAVNSIFSGDFARILMIIISVLAIAAGVFILIRFFGISISITEILLIILAITWLIFILMIDIVYPINNKGIDFIAWLRSFGSHVMVLAGIILGTRKFGI